MVEIKNYGITMVNVKTSIVLPWYMFKKKRQNIAKHTVLPWYMLKKANFVKSMHNYFAYYAITMVNVQTTIVLP